jgi:phosphoserine phosphatase RsbU/P
MSASHHRGEDRFERLRTLTEVSRALTYTTSIEEVLELAVERAAGLMGADKALLMLTDDDGLLVVRAAFGLDPDRISEFREPLNETLIRRLQGLMDNPSEESFLSVPLVAQGEVTGLLAAVRPRGNPTTEDDEWLLSALADQTAVALENARLTREVSREQDERRSATEAQGRAHAVLSHELRTPLTAVESYSSILLEGLLGPLNDRQRESVARIRMSGEHLLSIIENVLDVARINAGTITLSAQDVPVADVVRQAVEILQPVATPKNQELRTRVEEELVARGDPHRIRQALVNLLSNAIKYSRPGDPVEVEASVTGQGDQRRAAIAVTDTGRGMTPEVVSRIFEPYVRGAQSDPEPGLGLGLYISRELVRQMGGEIEVRSQPGAGSTFTLFLPLA